MDSTEKFHQTIRILATIAMIIQGLHYAMTQPGPWDTWNGCVHGLALYAIWFARERKYKEPRSDGT